MTATPEDVLAGRARWCVVHGDCLQVLPTLPEKSVAHVITDPPYEAEAHTLQRRITRQELPGNRWGGGRPGVGVAPVGFEAIRPEVRRQVAWMMARAARRWLLVFCQVEAAPRWAGAIQRDGLAKYVRTCVWVKPDGQPQLSGDRPGMGYETFCVAHGPGACRWNGGGLQGVFVHNTARWDGAGEHDTPKPIALMLELVELFTDPDEVVLDPFAGSGTTGVACLRLGRRVILIEKSEKYAALTRERMEAEEKGLTLRDARAGQLPLLSVSKSEKPDSFIFGK